MTHSSARNRNRFYIGGEWVKPAGSGTIEIVSPYSERVIGAVPNGTEADVDRAVAAARQALDGPWSSTSPAERAAVLEAATEGLRKRESELSDLLTEEMGSPVMLAAPMQVGPLPAQLTFFADYVRSFVFQEVRRDLAGTSLVVREPVGVVAAIIPWNAPIAIAINKLAPALAAGCPVVLKPAPEAPLTSFALAEIFHDAGLPAGMLNVVPASREVGAYLVSHPGIEKVAFTGSTATGKRIMASCAEQVKRLSLELGGKSAGILLDDVDIATAVPAVVMGAMTLSGQICGAQTRLLVPRAREREVTDAICAAATATPVGDPRDPTTIVGPLVASRQRDRVEGYIALGKQEGARVGVGGGRPASQRTGWYVEPTIFLGVENAMRIAQEEIFGPVLCVIPYRDDADAIRIANESSYGLAGGVWTSDPGRGVAVARKVRAGWVMVNGSPPAVATPFGGFKQSGMGREMGPEAFHEYLEEKAITVPADAVRAS